MYKLLFAFFMCSVSVGLVILTERCRRNSQRCPDMFMAGNGLTRSFVALRFIGRADEARRAIVEDARLRQEYLDERYFLSLLGLLVAIGALLA